MTRGVSRLKPHGAERQRRGSGLGTQVRDAVTDFWVPASLSFPDSLRVLIRKIGVLINGIPGTVFC